MNRRKPPWIPSLNPLEARLDSDMVVVGLGAAALSLNPLEARLDSDSSAEKICERKLVRS